jgi:hypothetical protein
MAIVDIERGCPGFPEHPLRYTAIPVYILLLLYYIWAFKSAK